MFCSIYSRSMVIIALKFNIIGNYHISQPHKIEYEKLAPKKQNKKKKQKIIILQNHPKDTPNAWGTNLARTCCLWNNSVIPYTYTLTLTLTLTLIPNSNP